MNEIKVTVLMPCYNAADYIADAIQSVLAQTFRDFELLIINDGSTDRTADLVASFQDKRIVYMEQAQQGVGAALNEGLKHSRAEYIARFDADDICTPDRLEKQFRFMRSNPEFIVCGSGARYIDNDGNYIYTYCPPVLTNEEIQAQSFQKCPFIHASVMYKKGPVARIGYNIHAHSFEDHLLWLKLKPEGKMCNLPEPLLHVRLNPGSLTMDERKRSGEFRRIKNRALMERDINTRNGTRLHAIISHQNRSSEKESAYYSLLAKKFLWNNYDPSKARMNMKKAIQLHAFDPKDYGLLFISYLPEKMIKHLYSLIVSVR